MPPSASRWNQNAGSIEIKNRRKSSSAISEGKVYIEGGTFTMGARENRFDRADEFTRHQIKVNSFYMGNPIPFQQ